MKKFTALKYTTIILFFVLLLVWLIAITKKEERIWANNPWLPTMIGALVWSVWIDNQNRY